ncbi:MAG: sigma-70 family RNA polymerase sigma factor [Bacillota bacterium]|nr:sigma-70 family RNA polymerase sigma factor [Bacillota bacterium]
MIVKLYLSRDEAAIAQSKEKYDSYCYSVAFNVLKSAEDAKECVNDTYMRAWNSIPPNKPEKLSAYLGKIARNLAFDRYRKEHADKRGNGEMSAVLDELSECVASNESVEGSIDRQELINEINAFLKQLPKLQCDIFLLRYWYVMPVNEISQKCNVSTSNVTTILSRVRKSLKEYLVKRGFEI